MVIEKLEMEKPHARYTIVATFVVPRTNTRLGDRTFPVAGPRLGTAFRPTSDLTPQQFRRALKTYSVWLTETPAPSDFYL